MAKSRSTKPKPPKPSNPPRLANVPGSDAIEAIEGALDDARHGIVEALALAESGTRPALARIALALRVIEADTAELGKVLAAKAGAP